MDISVRSSGSSRDENVKSYRSRTPDADVHALSQRSKSYPFVRRKQHSGEMRGGSLGDNVFAASEAPLGIGESSPRQRQLRPETSIPARAPATHNGLQIPRTPHRPQGA